MTRTPESMVLLGGNLIAALLDDYDKVQNCYWLVRAAEMATSRIEQDDLRDPLSQLLIEIETQLKAIVDRLEAGNEADIQAQCARERRAA